MRKDRIYLVVHNARTYGQLDRLFSTPLVVNPNLTTVWDLDWGFSMQELEGRLANSIVCIWILILERSWMSVSQNWGQGFVNDKIELVIVSGKLGRHFVRLLLIGIRDCLRGAYQYRGAKELELIPSSMTPLSWQVKEVSVFSAVAISKTWKKTMRETVTVSQRGSKNVPLSMVQPTRYCP